MEGAIYTLNLWNLILAKQIVAYKTEWSTVCYLPLFSIEVHLSHPTTHTILTHIPQNILAQNIWKE